MTAWIAVGITGLVAAASFARALWLGGRRDGKIDAILERLTEGHEDHETRIRGLEYGRRR
jgi:hypothetical protein